MLLIHSTAFSAACSFSAVINMLPLSSISIVTSHFSIISLITLPPVPITSRIFSGLICKIKILGAHFESLSRAPGKTFSISLRIFCLLSFAFSNVSLIIFSLIPEILTSICIAVIPWLVPATLKSISP